MSKNSFNPQNYYIGNDKINICPFEKVIKRKNNKKNFMVDDIIKIKKDFNYINKNGNEIELLEGYNGVIKHYASNKCNNKNFTSGSYLILIDEIDKKENVFYFSETELWGYFKVIRRFNKDKKKILCKYYHELGHCKLKDKCPYMHGNLIKKPSKYKKILCKNFYYGSCPYGINCYYAHYK